MCLMLSFDEKSQCPVSCVKYISDCDCISIFVHQLFQSQCEPTLRVPPFCRLFNNLQMTICGRKCTF